MRVEDEFESFRAGDGVSVWRGFTCRSVGFMDFIQSGYLLSVMNFLSNSGSLRYMRLNAVLLD
jgi:hypothetical protein